MCNGGMKTSAAKERILLLNEKFHTKSLLGATFYSQLLQKGFQFQKCILVSIFPDGGNTYVGEIIRQDGRIIKFDIDLDNIDYSRWDDITNEYIKIYDRFHSKKPWKDEVIAYDLYKER